MKRHLERLRANRDAKRARSDGAGLASSSSTSGPSPDVAPLGYWAGATPPAASLEWGWCEL